MTSLEDLGSTNDNEAVYDQAEYLFNKGDMLGALFLFKKLAKNGFTPALAEIGNIYEIGGAGLSPDSGKAKKWYLKSIFQQNAPSAHLALARLLINYAESNDDYLNALHHFEVVINYNNHIGALFGSAYLYEVGLGVSQNLIKAEELYTLAIEQGHIMALRGLARVIFHKSISRGALLHIKASFKLFWVTLQDPDDFRLGIRWR